MRHGRPHRAPSDHETGHLPQRVPFVWAVPAYVGGLAILTASTLTAPFRPRRGQPRITALAARHLEALLALGLPLLALVNVAFGSVLAMQAFFRATFPETNGAVVGVGLVRSVAPWLTGMMLAVMTAVRASHELLGGAAPNLDCGDTDEPNAEDPDIGRLVLGRLIASVLAGPVLALWGAAVGAVAGALISKRVLGVASGTYYGFLFEMLQSTDIIGLVVLSAAYATAGCLFACHEALRSAPTERPGPPARAMASTYRAVLMTAAAMLVINSTWFSLVYLSDGPAPPKFTAIMDAEDQVPAADMAGSGPEGGSRR